MLRPATRRDAGKEGVLLSEDLSASGQVARLALESADIGVAVLDGELRYAYVNRFLADLNGRSVADHIGRRFDEIVPQFADELETLLQRALVEDEFEAHFDALAPDCKGHERLWRTSLCPLRSASGTSAVVALVQDVTEARQAERERDDQMQRLRTVVENSIDLIALFDGDGICTYASPSYRRILGYDPRDLVGRSALHIVEPEDHRAAVDAFHALQSGGRIWISELRLRHADGHPVVIECAARATCHESGEIDLAFLFGHDVTDRKRAEDELRESEALLRTMLDAAASPMALSQDGLLLEVNRAWLEMLGYERDAVIGRSPLDFIAPEDLPFVADHFERDLTSPYTLRAVRKDGSRRTFRAQATNTVYRGRPARVSSGVDVTALRQNEDRYRDLLEGIDAVVAEADPETFTFTFVSPRAIEMLGFPIDDWLEPGFWERRMHPDDRDATLAECRRAVDEGRDHEQEYRVFARDGRAVWIHHRVRLVRDGDRVVALRCVLVDTTLSKSEQAERQRLEAELRQAQKLEAIGRFAGGVAHDFANVLAAITMYADSAADASAEPTTRADLTRIRDAARRGRAMTAELLAFSRHEELPLDPLDLSELVTDMLELLNGLVGDRVELSLDLARDLLPVMANRTRIEQVVINLVANARDAMPDGGQIRIETGNVRVDANGRPRANGAPWALLAVVDGGVGMDAETRSRAFEPLFTSKQFGEGTGLGLSTVYAAVKQAGGRVEIDSAVGEGTRVEVCLPQVETVPATDHVVNGEERILLVEDDAEVRVAAARALQASGYRVTSVPDATTALTNAGCALADADLVITDAMMPGRPGVELADELARIKPELPVLIVSGDASPRTVGGSRGARRRLLAKPFSVDALADAVRDMLDES
jgi:two-component system, cell cycle sensor histidine kinase and response regulator CckA